MKQPPLFASLVRSARPVVGLMCLVGALTSCGRNAADHVRKGDTYVAQQRFAEAVLEYRAALQTNPKLGDVRLKLGDTYMRQRDLKNALAEYVRAADLLPNDASAQLKAGHLLAFARQFQDARARADRALAIDPKNADAQVLLGNVLAGLKDFDDAISEYQTAIALDPTRDTSYQSLAALEAARGKSTEAEASFKKAVEVAPRSLTAHLALANFYWSNSRFDEAEQAFKAAFAVDPDSLPVNRALGLFYVATNRLPQAEQYFVALTRAANDNAAVFALADYYVIAKRRDEARRVLNDQRLLTGSGAGQALLRLASLDAAEGHRAQALNRLHDLLEREPKNGEARLLSAQLQFDDGKHDQALADASAVIANEPNSSTAANAWLLTGSIQTLRDQRDEAIRAYEQVLKVQAHPLKADIALARLYLQRHDPTKAATYAQQALTIRRDDPEALDALVRADLMVGNMRSASADLARLPAKFKDTIGALKLTALVQVASNQFEAARATYKRCLQLDDNDLEAFEGLQRLDVANGRATDAVARIDARLKAAKPTVELLLLAARTHASSGDVQGLESLLLRAIEAGPDRLEAYTLLGHLYARQRRLDDAKDRFQDVLSKNPKSVAAATMIGLILEQQGRVAEAEKQYRQVLGIDRRAPVAANNLAWIYVASNRSLDEAVQLAQTAHQMLPEEPAVNDTLGWALFRKNLAAQAVPYLEKSAESDPNTPMYQYHVGMAYVQLGEWTKGRAALKHAFALKPDFDGAPEARKALTMIGG